MLRIHITYSGTFHTTFSRTYFTGISLLLFLAADCPRLGLDLREVFLWWILTIFSGFCWILSAVVFGEYGHGI